MKFYPLLIALLVTLHGQEVIKEYDQLLDYKNPKVIKVEPHRILIRTISGGLRGIDTADLPAEILADLGITKEEAAEARKKDLQVRNATHAHLNQLLDDQKEAKKAEQKQQARTAKPSAKPKPKVNTSKRKTPFIGSQWSFTTYTRTPRGFTIQHDSIVKILRNGKIQNVFRSPHNGITPTRWSYSDGTLHVSFTSGRTVDFRMRATSTSLAYTGTRYKYVARETTSKDVSNSYKNSGLGTGGL